MKKSQVNGTNDTTQSNGNTGGQGGDNTRRQGRYASVPAARRHGLLAPADDVPDSALLSGILTGSLIAVFMMLAFCIPDLAGGGNLTNATVVLWIIVGGMGIGVLQQVFFNPNVLGLRLAYPARTALFGACAFVLLAVSAWFGGWIPRDVPAAWISFAAAFLVILAVLTVALGKTYQQQATQYDKYLAAYRKDHAGK